MLLSVRALSKTFHLSQNGNMEVTPFREVSFEIKQGTFLGITGPSGVGKSSILKCIYRTYLPTSGHVYYQSANNGVMDLADMPERSIIHLRKREIGYVSQFLRVIPRVSALRLVAERLQSTGVARDHAVDQAEAMLERMQLPRRLWDCHPASFSGGEQQRINLAKATIVKPRLLILDEPTASLDAVSKACVLELLQDMKRQGTTMLGVFHDIDFMEHIADQLLDLRIS
jgi:alpha-D-ribose 1-methylphosphonate 5-triphosphate synthase subunit PhnL